MIIHHRNKPLDSFLIEQLVDSFKKDEYLFPSKHAPDKVYSSFRKGKEKLPEFPGDVNAFYHNLIKELLISLGVYGRVVCTNMMWCQIYNDTTCGHPVHAHFSGEELFSWIHFVKAPKQNCFFFVDSNSQQIFPEHQNSGDLIVFPSWVMHGAEPISDSDDRIIVAGNIIANQYLDTPFSPHIMTCERINSNVKQWKITDRHD